MLLEPAQPLELQRIPLHSHSEMVEEVTRLCAVQPPKNPEEEVTDSSWHPARISAMMLDRGLLLLLLSTDGRHQRRVLATRLAEGESFPSLSAILPQAHAFERALWEDHGVIPLGHPWLKPLRRHRALEPEGRPVAWKGPAVDYPFYRVEGQGVHEVAVGPVHAGVIEPGHFRFQCEGENVFHLEIHLGYQHRGAEQLLLQARPARRLMVAESLAGDTVIGHSWAWCMALENLAGAEVPLRAEAIRALALELERLANHVGDLGMLANDVGYLPGASWFGRLRGEFLNLLMELSGNRFGRGLLMPGGVRFDLSAEQATAWRERLKRAERDLRSTATLMLEEASVMGRFEGTGTVPTEMAERLGLVGLAARASGLARDVRHSHPHGMYRHHPVAVQVDPNGDVRSRAQVRWQEVETSLGFLQALLADLPEGALYRQMPRLAADSLGVGVVEGWRGEIVHLITTAADGSLSAVKVVDPSLHNWFGLAKALRNQQISDFPLCNKSFNLSYAGHDL